MWGGRLSGGGGRPPVHALYSVVRVAAPPRLPLPATAACVGPSAAPGMHRGGTCALLPSRAKHSSRNIKIKPPGGQPLLFREEDVVEQYVRGGGAGGQAVAKTSNCVVLKHLPTGTVVRCHKTRSRDLNRRLARTELQLRLDEALRGTDSVRGKKREKGRKRAAKQRARSAAKYGGVGAGVGRMDRTGGTGPSSPGRSVVVGGGAVTLLPFGGAHRRPPLSSQTSSGGGRGKGGGWAAAAAAAADRGEIWWGWVRRRKINGRRGRVGVSTGRRGWGGALRPRGVRPPGQRVGPAGRAEEGRRME